MGPRKYEGSYWGYEDQGNGQLQSYKVSTCPKQHYRVMLKIGRKAQVKQ